MRLEMHRSLWALLALLLYSSMGSMLLAQSTDPTWGPNTEAATMPPPLRLGAASDATPMISLGSALQGARDQINNLAVWNRLRIGPPQNGFSRPLPQPVEARFPQEERFPSASRPLAGGYLATAPGGGLIWGASVQVEGAYRLRLHLAIIDLPVGTRMWVYGKDKPATNFGLELRSSDGDLWTPSVSGERLYFEVQLPARKERGGARILFDKVLELFRLTNAGDTPGNAVTESPNTSCLTDATCVGISDFPAIDLARHAIAQLQYIKGGKGFLCTGGLLNDTNADFIPYLLTANHCFSDQSAASSLEAFWDFKTSSCGGTFPDESGFPKSSGSTLLATGALGAQSDFTLVKLNSIPAGRVLLGWNANSAAIAQGAALYRVSHPLGFPQAFSKTLVNTTPTACQGALPQPTFIYSQLSIGGALPGSSGSPVMLANGQVVGQLYGGCGPTAQQGEGCDPANEVVDGAFSATYPFISPWLHPTTSGGPCVRDAATACLANGRFEVKVDWQTDSMTGTGQVMSFAGQRAENNDSAFYWFFSTTNFEMGLKILDACGLNQQFWVFISGLTNQGWNVHIRDTKTGVTKTYSNAVNHLTATTADTSAFNCS